MPGMYDHWSVADHLTNIKVVLKAIMDKGATPGDVMDAFLQIDIIRQKLGLPTDAE